MGVTDLVNITMVQHLVALVQNTGKVGKASGTFAKYYATPFLQAMGLGVLDLTVPYSWDPPHISSIKRLCQQDGIAQGWPDLVEL